MFRHLLTNGNLQISACGLPCTYFEFVRSHSGVPYTTANKQMGLFLLVTMICMTLSSILTLCWQLQAASVMPLKKNLLLAKMWLRGYWRKFWLNINCEWENRLSICCAGATIIRPATEREVGGWGSGERDKKRYRDGERERKEGSSVINCSD